MYVLLLYKELLLNRKEKIQKEVLNMLGIILLLICLIIYSFRGLLKAFGAFFITCCIVTLLGKWFLIGCFFIVLVFVLVTKEYKK